MGYAVKTQLNQLFGAIHKIEHPRRLIPSAIFKISFIWVISLLRPDFQKRAYDKPFNITHLQPEIFAEENELLAGTW